MIFVLFKEFEFCNANCGYVSKFSRKGRGVNQGCPTSPIIYLYAGEILAHLLSANKDVRGVDIAFLQHILSQFADDMTSKQWITFVILWRKLRQISASRFHMKKLQCIEWVLFGRQRRVYILKRN